MLYSIMKDDNGFYITNGKWTSSYISTLEAAYLILGNYIYYDSTRYKGR